MPQFQHSVCSICSILNKILVYETCLVCTISCIVKEIMKLMKDPNAESRPLSNLYVKKKKRLKKSKTTQQPVSLSSLLHDVSPRTVLSGPVLSSQSLLLESCLSKVTFIHEWVSMTTWPRDDLSRSPTIV